VTTTALAVELVIIGYQALIWILLGISLFPFFSGLQITTLKEWKEPLVIASLVAAYTSGAIINGVVSKIMSLFEGKK
jgi:hypothetical protein